jgi:hypothetical protein
VNLNAKIQKNYGKCIPFIADCNSYFIFCLVIFLRKDTKLKAGIRYTLKNVDGEGWKLVDQILLEQNK